MDFFAICLKNKKIHLRHFFKVYFHDASDSIFLSAVSVQILPFFKNTYSVFMFLTVLQFETFVSLSFLKFFFLPKSNLETINNWN